MLELEQRHSLYMEVKIVANVRMPESATSHAKPNDEKAILCVGRL